MFSKFLEKGQLKGYLGPLSAITCTMSLILSLWVLDAKAESKSCEHFVHSIPNFTLSSKPVALPDIEISTLEGTPTRLSDYTGQVVLLNHWAIWCAPCIHEMPTITSLADKMSDKPVAVIPLSMDRGGYKKVAKFVERQKWDHAHFLSDKTVKIGRHFDIRLIPATQIFDKNGNEFGRLAGTYEWDSDNIISLMNCLSEQ